MNGYGLEMPGVVGIPVEDTGDPGKGSSVKSLLKQFCSDYRRSNGAFSKRREEWKKFVRAYHGKPFNEGVITALAGQDKVLSNFNFALSTINALIGQEQADRKEARFLGIDKSEADSFGGELMTDLVRHLFLRARGHQHLSRVQLDQLLTGYGWIEAYLDTRKFPFEVAARHVDVFSIYVDPRYQEDNCADAKYVIHKCTWDLDDVVARWPKKQKELRSLLSKSTGGDLPRPKKSTGDAMGYAKGPNDTNFRSREDKDRLEVSNYQFKMLEPWVAFQDPATGEERVLPREKFDELMKQLSQMPDPQTGQSAAELIQEVGFQKEVVYTCWIAGLDEDTSVILEEPKMFEGSMFSYRCATAYAGKEEDSGFIFHFGLMAMIYDPQLWITKSFSAMIDFISQQQKGGGFIKASALANPASFQSDRNKPGYWHLASDAANLDTDIRPNQTMQFPNVYERILEFAINAIPRLTTVTDAVKGTMTSERSNVLISNLQQHSQMVLNPLFDPMSRLQIDLSVVIARFAQFYLPVSIIDKILGERKCENVTFTKGLDQNTGKEGEVPVLVDDYDKDGNRVIDPQTGQPQQRPIRPSDIIRNLDLLDYDVDVDLGAASVTSKQAFTGALMQTNFGKILQDAGLLSRFMPYIIRNWPGMPANDAKKLSDEIEADEEAKRAMQNPQMVMAAIQTMPPEQQQMLVQQIQQLMAQAGMSPQGGGAPAPQQPQQPQQPQG